MTALPSNPPKSQATGSRALPPAMFTTNSLALAGVILLCFVAVFWWFFIQQHRFSWGSADWSHAYMVPLISGYILWQSRREIVAIKPTVFWPGLIPLALSIPCYILFQMGPFSTHMGLGWSVVLAVFGVTLLLTGPALIQPLFLPIAYLAFGVTVAEMVMIKLTFVLQGIAAEGGWTLLNILGVRTELSGHTLTVYSSAGDPIPLNIAQACSGMRMVIAFAALGVAVALVGLKHWWQRLALILLGLPVAVAMNIVRVAVLGIASLSNPQFAQGQAHMTIGVILLVGAFFAFMGIAWVLKRLVHDAPPPTTGPNPVFYRAEPLNWTRAFTQSRGAVTAVAFLLVTAVALNAAVAALGVALRKQPIHAADNRSVAAIPKETEHWITRGEDQIMSSEMVEELGTSNYLSRLYVRKSSKPGERQAEVALHLAYYTGMIDTVPHVADRCMTAAGMQPVTLAQELPVSLDQSTWSPDDVTSAKPGTLHTAKLPFTFTDAPGVRVRLPRGSDRLVMRFSTFDIGHGQRSIAGYFFIANGGLCPSPEGVRLLAFQLDDTYAYYLKVQTQVTGDVDAQEAARLSGALLSDLFPEIARCAPDWIEVERGRYPPDNPKRNTIARP